MSQYIPLYLPDSALQIVQEGRFPFFRKVGEALATHNWILKPCLTGRLARTIALLRGGPALFWMDDPTHNEALVCRQTYVKPFWHIERSAQRWKWPVALAHFNAGDPKEARQFANYWRKQLYKGRTEQAHREGYVFLPLQGMLQKHRSFQSMSPLAMLTTVLQNDKRPVLATLHPREYYSPTELAALDSLRERYTRLRIATGGAEQALLTCDLVVSMNSAVAFHSYFFRKPVMLFGQIDFHHIAASVPRDGLEQAFTTVEREVPDYDGYLHWFLKQQSINFTRQDSQEQIIAALRRGGWPI